MVGFAAHYRSAYLAVPVSSQKEMNSLLNPDEVGALRAGVAPDFVKQLPLQQCNTPAEDNVSRGCLGPVLSMPAA